MDARSFQAFAAILDWLTHLAPISCWYRSDAGQEYLKLLYVESQKYEVMTMSVVGGRPKKNDANPSYKATKHIERTFLLFSLLIITNTRKLEFDNNYYLLLFLVTCLMRVLTSLPRPCIFGKTKPWRIIWWTHFGNNNYLLSFLITSLDNENKRS